MKFKTIIIRMFLHHIQFVYSMQSFLRPPSSALMDFVTCYILLRAYAKLVSLVNMANWHHSVELVCN